MSRTATLFGLLVLAGVGLAGVATHTAQSDTRPAAAGFASSSFRFPQASGSGPGAELASPIQLTASDGTGLSLVALEANGVLEPPLAFTELHLTFENPRDQRIEGRFRIALPPGAALSRFAMKIGGAWQEGEVVERQRARVAYEDALHRRVDPALLEQEAGNEFSARVFPILPRERKEIVVSYSYALARADEPYVLPLQGLSSVGRLDVRVLLGDHPAGDSAAGGASNLETEVHDRRVVELHKRDWTPDQDLKIGQDRVANRAGLRQGNLAVVRVSAPGELVEAKRQEIAGLYVLVDSSASRALGYATQVSRVAELVAGLRGGAGGSTPLGIAAFDQEVMPVFEGRAGDFGEAETARLRSRRPLGASDLGKALGWLGDRMAKSGNRYPRVLLVTDGVATAGDTEGRALKAAVKALGSHGVERLDVLAVGGLRDEATLKELTTGNLVHDGQRIDGAAPLAEIARRLTLACRSGIPVAIAGAAWVWPDTLDGVQPGDETLVYADLPAKKSLRLTVGGRALTLGDVASAERPLLERAWAQARIERLLHLRETASAGDDDLRRALGLEIVEVSVRNRVLSPFTAMLVLESTYDYQRFGLDQHSLADILTVGPGGLDVLARTRPAAMESSSSPKISGPEPDFENDAGSPAAENAPAAPDVVALPVEEPLPDGVPGRVEGGVAGGVVGGVAGGVPGGVPSGERQAAAQPVEVPSNGPGPRRAVPPPPAVPPPAPRPIVAEDKKREVAPYSGRFAKVKEHLAAGRIAQARSLAEAWNTEAPGDVLALLALGEAWEAAGEPAAAARAYGSLIDLFPSRADLRRLAGERLERLGDVGRELAIDTYQKAVAERPDHPSGHRLLAWALLRAGRYEAAFEALEQGIEQKYPGGRFAGVDRVLKEDLGLLAAAWLHAEPARRDEVIGRLQAHQAHLETEPSLRFALTWETDANDVDLHVWDHAGGHAFYNAKTLPSGGELFADVTTGYGPECFAVREPATRDAAPYRLKVHYYSRGPMGYGMGTVQVIAHDGHGGLTVEPRPFVVMVDQAMVDLGSVEEGKAPRKAAR
ncbi:MAG TPA: VIT domain-containing protein [Thermoanaerobaculia bacterium]|jgi:tetratricopeptide (TPR) repeat protein|nr:VIT domain-containing protein [Thermoanaerobaculia bacterium]